MENKIVLCLVIFLILEQITIVFKSYKQVENFYIVRENYL